MKLFTDYTFNWKELGIFKLAVVAIGALFGAYFSDFVKDYGIVFVLVAVLATAYTFYIALRQAK